MKRTVLLSLLGSLLTVVPLHAEPKSKKARPIEPPVQTATPAPESTIDFQGEEISTAVRALARRAKINLVVSDQVKGNVNIRIENKTPREAIEIIAQAKELILDEKDGIFYLRPKYLAPAADPETPKPEKSLEETIAETFTPAITQFYDSLLDYQSRPETARKIAKAKKALYEALMAEGFTKDEAFRIILTNQELALPESKK